MRAPLGWLAELVGHDSTSPLRGEQVAADLVRVGLEEEALHGGDIVGPLVVGRVVSKTDEPQKNGKTIHFCRVDVGEHGQRADSGDPAQLQEIVCGAHNFEVGDLVVVVLPGATLPGGFTISARKTYGHRSHGMICSAEELGIGEGGADGEGIIVLTRYLADRPELVASLEPGQDAIALLALAEETVEVNVTPDRGYCFSMRGVAREYALSTGAAGFVDPVGPAAVEAPPANADGYPVRLVDDAPIHGVAGCDRYVARVVRGVDATAVTPSWLATRLVRVGMRPISLAVDVTNYLMLLTGQPLHAFDLGALSGSIEVRRARAGETLTTLDDVERRLDPQDLLITDGGSTPLAIAGVMGGRSCEVGPGTSDVLIESAHFDPVGVARSSRRHRLSTEASKRFERGVDPAMTAAVAELAVRLLVQLGGGVADPGVTDVDERPVVPPIPFETRSAWASIEPGQVVPAGLGHEDVVAALRALGCEVDGEVSAEDGFGRVSVQPPSWRPDLRNGPDLVEEVARLRGYDRIPSILPTAPSGRGLTRGQRSVRLVSALLAGMGLTEAWTYPFVSPTLPDALGYDAQDERRRAVRLANPLSDEAPLMRTSVLDSLLPALRLNVRRGAADVALYEVGLAFDAGAGAAAPVPPVGRRPDDATLAAIDAAVPAQPRHVALAVAGDAEPAGPFGPARPWVAADAIAIAVAVGRALGVSVTPQPESERAPWHPGRCARLELSDGAVVGYAGELHPKVVAALELPARTCAAELDLDVLVAAGGAVVQAKPLSTYPVATSDVALTVDEAVPAARVEAALRDGAGAELESVQLFDVYRGDQVGRGAKSLAYRLSFRAADRTLTTGEVSAARDAAVAAAAAATGAVQRG